MRMAPSKFIVDFQTLARLMPKLVLCVVFMFAGANFSHENELHHQHESQGAAHHSAVDQKLTETSIVPHSHFEQENLDNGLNEISIHCGSPELQPNAVIFSHDMVVIGAVGNCFRMVFAGTAFDLEPPPPRT